MELSNVSPLRIGMEIAESLLRDAIPVKARVGGTSMLPWLRAGDIVTLKNCPLDTVRKGDIVVFKRFEKLVIHRVIAYDNMIAGIAFITKGDSCKHTDGYILPSDFLGKAFSYERKGSPTNLTDRKHLRFNRFLAAVSLYTWPVYSVYFKCKALTNRFKYP